DRGHGAGAADVLRSDRLAVPGVADDDAPEPLPQLGQRAGQREDGHHLRGGGDVETGLPGHTVDPVAQADDDVPQRPVVDVEHPAPGDAGQVQACVVPLVEVVVDQRRQQVVRRRDRVEVTGQVQVQG